MPLNQKTNHIKYKPNMGFLSVSKMARGGRLFEGGDYSKEGNYSREAINRGTAIIGGNTVFVSSLQCIITEFTN